MTLAPPVWSVLPFMAMLLVIAVCPLWVPHWWESNRNKLVATAMMGLPVLLFYGVRHPAALAHAAQDYVSFVVLLAGLYVISGGILLRGDLVATPATNTAFLALGGALASFVGTTGASKLFVRPVLHTNSERTHVRHTVIFFIFVVSKVGGMLTPLGDPPLFLGYLAGVPFIWTFSLWRHWAFLLIALLAGFYVWDSIAFRREPEAAILRDRVRTERLRVEGGLNVLWLVGVVLAVAVLGAPWREIVILALAVASLRLTPTPIRRDNGFSAGPMVEVAVLFAGIFLTMIPALELLRLRGDELGVRAPWQFFWASGSLSSFLDNAPIYLTFLALGQGLRLADEIAGVPEGVLVAISVGSVAMGANTYIGNAPNFMVKAIAEAAGVRMPSFAEQRDDPDSAVRRHDVRLLSLTGEDVDFGTDAPALGPAPIHSDLRHTLRGWRRLTLEPTRLTDILRAMRTQVWQQSGQEPPSGDCIATRRVSALDRDRTPRSGRRPSHSSPTASAAC